MTADQIDDDALVASIEFLVECGVRDAAGGGVSSVTMAEHHPATQDTLREHSRELAERGDLVKVHGIGGPRNRPRPSYLPADHPDATTGGKRGAVEVSES